MKSKRNKVLLTVLALFTSLLPVSSSKTFAETSEQHPTYIEFWGQTSDVEFDLDKNEDYELPVIDESTEFYLSATTNPSKTVISCEENDTKFICKLDPLEFDDFLSSSPNWESAALSPFQVKMFREGINLANWPAIVTLSHNKVLNEIEVTDNLGGSFIAGSSNPKITLSIRVLNALGNTEMSDIHVFQDGETVASFLNTNGSATVTLLGEDLKLGENQIVVSAQNEYSELGANHLIVKELPVLSAIEILSPLTFFPFKDSYQDNLDFRVNLVSGASRELVGQGSIVLTDPKGKQLVRKNLTKTGSYPLIFKIPPNQVLFGNYKTVVTFTPKGGKTTTKTKVISGSSKRMVETSGSLTVSAWQAVDDCGSSYDPCKKGSLSGSANGIGLYNDAISRDHESYFSVKVPGDTFKWKVTLNNFWNGLFAPEFYLNATDYSGGESYGYLGSTPSTSDWEGNWTSGWANGIDGGRANWKMTSSQAGYIYFQSVTITYVKRSLK